MDVASQTVRQIVSCSALNEIILIKPEQYDFFPGLYMLCNLNLKVVFRAQTQLGQHATTAQQNHSQFFLLQYVALRVTEWPRFFRPARHSV